MKFSILTLLAATAYVALVFAAIAEPLSWSRHAATFAWLAVLVYSLILATDSTNQGNAIFGRVMLGGVAAYLILILLQTLTEPAVSFDLLPHQWFVDWQLIFGIQPTTVSQTKLDKLHQQTSIEFIAALNTSLVVGLFGGCLALWRYRVLERREKTTS